jgi:hypothetical protein
MCINVKGYHFKREKPQCDLDGYLAFSAPNIKDPFVPKQLGRKQIDSYISELLFLLLGPLVLLLEISQQVHALILLGSNMKMQFDSLILVPVFCLLHWLIFLVIGAILRLAVRAGNIHIQQHYRLY